MALEGFPPAGRRFARDRASQIGSFYEREATSLQRAVARAVVAPAAMIEDACAHAWCQLVRRDEVELGPGGFWWLYVCAKREAYRLSGRSRREPAGGDPHELPESEIVVEDVSDTVERRLEHQARLEMLESLAERKRRMVILHAAGFSYEEIAQACGDSLRTVERQLLRGKRTLLKLQAAAAAEM